MLWSFPSVPGRSGWTRQARGSGGLKQYIHEEGMHPRGVENDDGDRMSRNAAMSPRMFQAENAGVIILFRVVVNRC